MYIVDEVLNMTMELSCSAVLSRWIETPPDPLQPFIYYPDLRLIRPPSPPVIHRQDHRLSHPASQDANHPFRTQGGPQSYINGRILVLCSEILV